jgi:glycerol uptake facilitator-like aquaporin
MSTTSLQRRVTAEFVGTLFLVATVIGSGNMAERLAGTNVALALLANTIATGAILVALIFTFGGISGAHFNPVVTVADAREHGMPWREVPAYIAAQCCGGLVGTIVAHLMFGLPLFSLSRHARSGGGQVFSEFVATLSGWSLHHGGVLLYFLNVVRESRSDHTQSGFQRLRRNTSH